VDPLGLVADWYGEAVAAGLSEPNAAALATATPDGRPSVRFVLIKGIDADGVRVFTNYESRKGRELLARPKAALCFHWQPLERQVRIEGSVTPVSDAEADEYFASRARGSQIGAWASRQSSAMEQLGDLDARVARYEREFEGRAVPRPPQWSGFRLAPARMEFWTGMPSRLHQRHAYSREGDLWRVETLYP
jgi:pyridoxamine 5'-phosphate oxidase